MELLLFYTRVIKDGFTFYIQYLYDHISHKMNFPYCITSLQGNTVQLTESYIYIIIYFFFISRNYYNNQKMISVYIQECSLYLQKVWNHP